jgi:hypothetical protein
LPENERGTDAEVYECPICGSEVPEDLDRCPGCGAWFDTSRLQCPICGEEVDTDVEECPKCGTLFGEGEDDADLDLFADLTCPVCGTPLDEDDTICPGCGQHVEITEVEDAEYESAPGAGMVNGTGIVSGRGMVNGMGLTNGAGMVNGRGMVNGKGLTNGAGMVNGRGMVNGKGLTNGAGMVNGRGMVNGEGMVNGAGFINGRGGTSADLSAREGLVNGQGIYDHDDSDRLLSTRMFIPPRRHRTKPLAITMVFVMVLVLITTMILIVPSSKEGIVIDGEFDDWNDVRRYSDRTGDYQNVNLDIDVYAIATEGDDLGIYLRVPGRILDGGTPANGVDTVLVLFDVDGSQRTGYSLLGMGIDNVIEVSGWDNTVHSAAMKEFRSSRDNLDWNGFVAIGAASASAYGPEVEIMATGAASWLDDEASSFAITLQTSALEGDWTYFSGPTPGAVQVRQTSLGDEGTYLQTAQQSPVLRIDVSSLDADASITYLTVTSAREPAPTRLDIGRCDLYIDSNRNGDFDSGDVSLANDNYGVRTASGVSFELGSSPIEVSRGSIQRLFVVCTISAGATQGRALFLSVPDPFSVEAGDLPVTVIPPEGKGFYIGGVDPAVTIDGLFEDWHSIFDDPESNVTRHADEQTDVERSSVDLYRYAQFIDPSPTARRALFYIETDPSGEALVGTPMPLLNLVRTVPGPGGPGGVPTEPPALVGQDMARFYLHVDGATPVMGNYGMQVTHLLEVQGQGGRVMGSSLLKYTGNAEDPWAHVANPVEAAFGGNELEVSLDTQGMTGLDVALVVLVGWDGSMDFGAPHLVDDPGAESRWGPWDDPLPIPEFQQILLPALGTLLAFGSMRRRRQRRTR